MRSSTTTQPTDGSQAPPRSTEPEHRTGAPAPSDADRYPSRVGRPPELIDRRDPVVYPGGEGPLDAALVRRFDERGYLNLPSVFTPEEVGVLDEAVDALVDELTPTMGDPGMADRLIIEPEAKAIRSICTFHDQPGPLRGLVAGERLAGVARQILASDVYVHQSRVNRKPGFRGEDFGWYSDFETWHTEDGMPAPRCLSASIALTDNHPFNGPLMVMPGSHYWFVTCPEPTPPANHESSLEQQEFGVPDDDSL